MKRAAILLASLLATQGCSLLFLVDCGDKIPQLSHGEECDDGNTSDGDGCSADCIIEFCGDKITNNKEECDDGNAVETDSCLSACIAASCGDGITFSGTEQCDDGNNNSDTTPNACRTNCTNPSCGDNVIDSGEQCDDGNLNSNDGCDSNCTNTACGNNIVTNGEECDDGNAVDGDGCDSDCTFTACGNNIVTNGEECDDGNNNSDTTPNACRTDCTNPSCGDNTLDDGEVCDDSNLIDGDGCDSNCTPTACGNSVVFGTEQCDDGNTINGDGCDSNCTGTACGNGIVTNSEACDDGNLNNNDSCSQSCQVESCGDGNTQSSEECDDGNAVDGDGCDSDCTFTACGNGIVTNGEECDDGVANSDADPDACRTDCTNPSCGDGVIDSGEQCEDLDNINTDECTNACQLPKCGDGIASIGEFCNFVSAGDVPVGNNPTSIIAAELDGTAGAEIVVTTSLDDTMTILHSDNASGTLSSPQILSTDDEPQFIIAADLSNNNASPDLELITLGAGLAANSNRIRVFANDNSGNFPSSSFLSNAGASVEGVVDHFRGNNILDLVSVDGSGVLHVFFTNGIELPVANTTVPLSSLVSLPTAIVSASLIGGLPGVVVLGESSNNLAFVSNNNSVFTLLPQEQPTLGSPTDLVVGNINAIGRDELVVVSKDTNEAQIFALTGSCATGADCVIEGDIASTGLNPQSVKLADVNRDGFLDVIVANQDSDSFRVIFTDDGSFSNTLTSRDFIVGDGPLDLVLVDLNGDGLLDVVTANQFSANVSVFLYVP